MLRSYKHLFYGDKKDSKKFFANVSRGWGCWMHLKWDTTKQASTNRKDRAHYAPSATWKQHFKQNVSHEPTDTISWQQPDTLSSFTWQEVIRKEFTTEIWSSENAISFLPCVFQIHQTMTGVSLCQSHYARHCEAISDKQKKKLTKKWVD